MKYGLELNEAREMHDEPGTALCAFGKARENGAIVSARMFSVAADETEVTLHRFTKH